MSSNVESILFKELVAYNRMKRKLLEKYEGKVVVIKDEKLVGVYCSEEEALKDVLERYGFVPVLIKRVVRDEKSEDIPAYVYGLLSTFTG